MRSHGKLAVLKDDEVDRLERAGAATMGVSRSEVLESMYNRLEPRPQGTLVPFYCMFAFLIISLMTIIPGVLFLDRLNLRMWYHAEPTYTAEEMQAMRTSRNHASNQVSQHSYATRHTCMMPGVLVISIQNQKPWHLLTVVCKALVAT